MNRRGDPSSVLIFLLLIITVLFQINLYTKNKRLDQYLSRFISAQAETGSGKNVHSKRDTTLLKDEGDRLVKGFSLEPRTLDAINVDSDIHTKCITTPYIYESLLNYDCDTVKLKPCLAEMLLNKRFKNVEIHRAGLNRLGWYVPKELQKYE